MQNNIMIIDDIKPTVQGFTMQVIETGQALQVQMDDLFEYMTLYTDKAHTTSQFNFEMDVMDDLELCEILGDMYIHSPEKFEATQPFPMPDVDHYSQFMSEEELDHIGQRPNLEEVQIISKELHQLVTAANEINEMKIDQSNLSEQIRILIAKVKEVVDSSMIMNQGQPTIDNLLYGYRVDRKCIRQDKTKGKYRTCSTEWLKSRLTEQDVRSLMLDEVVQIQSKSGKGTSQYKLKRVRIYG